MTRKFVHADSSHIISFCGNFNVHSASHDSVLLGWTSQGDISVIGVTREGAVSWCTLSTILYYTSRVSYFQTVRTVSKLC